MKKILIAGGGITSVLTSYLLRQKILTDILHITVWDKARGPGGRMTTSRSNLVPNCKVDLGLQYLSTTPNLLKENSEIYDELFKENIIEKLKANIENYNPKNKDQINYVAPNGSSSIVKHFLNKSNIDELHFNTFLDKIHEINTENNETLIEAISTNGKKELFDIVILTMPGPQVSDLIKRSTSMFNISKEYINLQNVYYSERYALGLFYNETFNNPFDIKYIKNDDIIRYISFDNIKRNRSNEPISVCIHTTLGFYGDIVNKSLDNDEGKSSVEYLIYNKLRELYPDWPHPVETKLQKWRYSQITKPYNNNGYMIYSNEPMVLSIGDSYVNVSNFDNCILSAKNSVKLLLEKINNDSNISKT